MFVYSQEQLSFGGSRRLVNKMGNNRNYNALIVTLAGMLMPISTVVADPSTVDANTACGPLSVAFCARLVGVEANIDEVIATPVHSARGLSMAELQSLAKSSGLATSLIQCSSRDAVSIASTAAPLIFLDRGERHYMVLTGASSSGEIVNVVDPLNGFKRQISESKFEGLFSGYGLQVASPANGELLQHERSSWWTLYIGAIVTAWTAAVIIIVMKRRLG